jgi:hypothetical protein
MAIRVDQEGFGQVVDPGSVGQRSSGAQVYDDGVTTPPWIYRPWKDKKEIAVNETLRLMAIPVEQIQAIRPPVPYVLFPEQELGFINHPPTIEDVLLDSDRWVPQIRSWFSPTVRPTARADYQDNAWSGTARGVSAAVNPLM